MRIVIESGEPFAFAGLWAVWKDWDGNTVPSCTIITTEANDLLGSIHHRMPMILPRELEGFCLDGSIDDPGVLASVLAPHPDDALEAYKVSTLVNSPRNNGPQVVEPVA